MTLFYCKRLVKLDFLPKLRYYKNMKISTKGRYALRIMIDIAQNSGKNCSAASIAGRQEISAKYTEQIVAMLLKNNLIKSKRGKEGGYSLSKKAKEISVLSVILATEGQIAIVDCLDSKHPCSRSKDCKTISCWSKLNDIILNYLKSVKLQDLL